MKRFRTLSTTRLIVVIAAVVTLASGSAALAVAASGGGGPTPPDQPLADAIHAALTGAAPDGITAQITFTNKLFPSGALTGATGSALLTGATGRLWATNDGRGRLELQSGAGDAQIVWNADKVTAYDATSNTVYAFTLPKQTSSTTPGDTGAPPALSEITTFLADLSKQANVSSAQPDNVANQPSYTVTISPKHDGGLLGSAQLAFDAARGVPLRIAIYAQGSSTPTLALEATDISYGAVAASDVNVAPPADAKVVDLSSAASTAHPGSNDPSTQVTGLAVVQAAVDFPLAAPDALVGVPRQTVRLVGKDAALVVYGKGLGAMIVVERKADAGSTSSGTLSALPTVSLGGVTAHELATQLGTVLEWQQGRRSFVLAGSLPPAAAQAAAGELK